MQLTCLLEKSAGAPPSVSVVLIRTGFFMLSLSALHSQLSGNEIWNNLNVVCLIFT